jgi:hypothetical protein
MSRLTMTGPELNHGALSRAELRQAARQAAALGVQSRGELATAWRHLAAALAELADARDPAHDTARSSR